MNLSQARDNFSQHARTLSEGIEKLTAELVQMDAKMGKRTRTPEGALMKVRALRNDTRAVNNKEHRAEQGRGVGKGLLSRVYLQQAHQPLHIS